VGIFPPNYRKITKERKGKENYITFDKTGGGFLVFLNDELTTFRQKIIDLFVIFKK